MECDFDIVESSKMKKIFFIFVSGSLIFLLTGCFVSELGSMSGRERIEYLKSIKPYGAHWIKEGMTRESRRVDYMQCGGGEHLSDGYKDWLSSIPYEIYAQGKSTHIKDLTACMHAKSYFYLEQCDARCLHP
jgi:hypothetical protein